MHDQYLAAQRRFSVTLDGNTSRIIGEAIALWEKARAQKIRCAEETKLPGWRAVVHSTQCDIGDAADLVIQVQKMNAALIAASENEEQKFKHVPVVREPPKLARAEGGLCFES